MNKSKEIIEKNILSSSHINFLFGAGVNGNALKQLDSFKQTKVFLEENGIECTGSLENSIDEVKDEKKREELKNVFINEFKNFNNDAMEIFHENESIEHLRMLLRETYKIVNDTQNRKPSMKQINIYTLNYDELVEKALDEMGYLYNSISASANSMKSNLLNIIGYNYSRRQYIPTFMISKIHGDIKNPIIPGKRKYIDILSEKYFEIVFNMKEQLLKDNSILMVIGYSGNDKHINSILRECTDLGLTVYWYKYRENDTVPDDLENKVFKREQDDYSNPKDTTLICCEDMEQVWEDKSEE